MKFYNIFFLFSFLFCLNSEVRGQTQVIPSLAAGGNITRNIGIGPGNSVSSGTLSILDATPSTGATTTWIGHDGSGTYSGVHLSALTTRLKVVAGLTQSTTNLQEWQNNAGTAQTATFSGAIGTVFKTTFGISYFGDGNLASEAKNSPAIMIAAGSTEIRFRSTGILSFSNSATDAGVSADTSLSRISAGVVGVGTGAAGSTAGTLQAATLQALGAGTASNPMLLGSGTWFTGGSATTTKPYLLIEPAGTSSNNWSTAGTGIGVNAASGFTGNLLQMDVASGIKFTVDSSGTTTGYYFISSLGQFASTNGTAIQMPSDGVIGLYGNTVFNRLQFGGTTSSFPALKRSTTGLIARLADDSADTWVQASQFRSTLTTPASAAATCTAGTIVADTGFVYVCTATDTWKRVAIATW